MRPPICAICDRDQRDHPELEFELVTFREVEHLDHPGHPEGLEWFCQDHLEAAKKRDHLLEREAIRQIREIEKQGPMRRFLRRLFGK